MDKGNCAPPARVSASAPLTNDMGTPDKQASDQPWCEQITPRLRKVGDFYELDGEEFRRVVGRPRTGRNPFDVLWELRELGRMLIPGGELPDDNLPDEAIRRTVGKTGPR